MASRAPEDGLAKPGLRVRKAERAKRRYAAAARQLLHERGYDDTSLDDIAEAAETSVSTLLRYFGSKERLALWNHVDALERFRDIVVAEHDTTIIERWRQFVADWADDDSYPFTRWADDRDLIASVPAINRLNAHLQRTYQDLLADAFAREAGVDPTDDLYGQLLAALLVAGNEAVFRRWLATGGERDLVTTVVAVVDFAEARLGSRDDGHPADHWPPAAP